MRISDSGPWTSASAVRKHIPPNPARFRGFTLVELLVVMLLIVIVLGIAGLTLHGSEARTLRTEAERLALLIETAHQESVLQGRVLVLAFAEDGYEFLTLDPQNELVPVSGDDLLRPRRFPVGVSVDDISIQGMHERKPRIILLPTGEWPEFSVTLIYGDARETLEGQANGEIRLRPLS